jgi:hypothetical protein
VVWSRSIADVNQYFKSVTLDFGGGSWFSASRTLDLSPEGYLIVSVSSHVFLASTNLLSSSPCAYQRKQTFVRAYDVYAYVFMHSHKHINAFV